MLLRRLFVSGALALAFVWLIGQTAAQNTPPISGTYSGPVKRSLIAGGERATRTYRVRLNDDLTTGTIDVYELDGKFVAHLGFAGVLSGLTFDGKTVVLNAASNYIPDNIHMEIAANHRSLTWYHNDGTMQGSGTLKR